MMDRTLNRVSERVLARIERLFDGLAATERGVHFAAPREEPLVARLRELTRRGGKRLRAALLVEAAACFDADAGESEAALDAAAALELLHAYFLVHDDIMDGDEVRRGGPAVHATLARLTGNARTGMALGILAGDLACALHEKVLSGLELPARRRAAVARIFAAMHLEVVHGQTLDVAGGADAEEVGSAKTAAYTTVGPLLAGAALAGAPKREMPRLAAFGRPLGVAFQLRDDWLGLFGRPDTTGKPVGTDLKTGKTTYLTEWALRHGTSDQVAAIRAVADRPDAGDEALAAAIRAVEASGARRACEERITDLVARAEAVLAPAPYRDEAKAFLLELARFVGSRET